MPHKVTPQNRAAVLLQLLLCARNDNNAIAAFIATRACRVAGDMNFSTFRTISSVSGHSPTVLTYGRVTEAALFYNSTVRTYLTIPGTNIHYSSKPITVSHPFPEQKWKIPVYEHDNNAQKYTSKTSFLPTNCSTPNSQRSTRHPMNAL